MTSSNKFIWLPVIFLGLILFSSCGVNSEENEQLTTPALDEIIEDGLRDSYFTGAVLIIGNDREILVEKSYGFAELYDENLRVVDSPDSMTVGHVFDLASLTKIFATTFGVMKLHSDGMIELDTSVAEYIPEFDRESHSEITIRHLLTHSSGLIQWYPTFYEVNEPSGFIPWVVNQPLISEPGSSRNYSDLGFMVLAQVIENITGMPFEDYLNDQLYTEAGLKKTGFNPDLSEINVVATSHGNPFEKKMVYDDNFGYRIEVDPESWDSWRDYTLMGEVNDGNAYYTFKGIAGHAGLFSTGSEVAQLLQIILNGGETNGNKIFSEETIREFTRKDSFENGLGWAMDERILNAESLPEGSLGHTGFTGANFVVSPKDNLFYIFLTNRQHVGVNDQGSYPDLREIRTQLASRVFAEISN